MSFFYQKRQVGKNKKNVLYKHSLLMQKTQKYMKTDRKRAAVFISDQGSITVEAAIVIPLFLMAVVTVLYLLIGIHAQNVHLSELFDQANRTKQAAYGWEKEWNSMENGELITINSRLQCPGFFGINEGIRFKQSIFYRPWVGSTMQEANTPREQMVYVTENGKVYHTKRNCTHLYLSRSETSYRQVDVKRNQNGARYKPCELCISTELTQDCKVYITREGNRYHINGTCSGLKRTIYEIPLESAGDKKLCSRCRE